MFETEPSLILLVDNSTGFCFDCSIGEFVTECEVNEESGLPFKLLVLGECEEVMEDGDVILSISKSAEGEFLSMLDLCCCCCW